MNIARNLNTCTIEEKTLTHPCFHCNGSNNARIHLPVAPECNIQCNYCVRKFDCSNESRPGVVSKVLTPLQAVTRYQKAKAEVTGLTVAGIAGPGDPLANFLEVEETLRLIRQIDQDVTFCLSTNGLMLPFYAAHLISLGVSHVTVTVNTVETETGAKIYNHINYLGKIYKGQEGAAILLQNQQTGIRYLTAMGVVVKVNIVLLKGINDHQVKDITRVVREWGVSLTNIIPLIPVKGSAFEAMEGVTNKELNRIRKECESIVPQMYHCKQCRADAVGTLNNDLSTSIFMITQEVKEMAESSNSSIDSKIGNLRFAVCSKDGFTLNQHFGHAEQFYIYDYLDGKAVFLELRKTDKYCNGAENGENMGKLKEKIKLLKDCDQVVCLRIGTAPALELKNNGIGVYTTYNGIEDGLREAALSLMAERKVRHETTLSAACAL